MTPLGSSVAKDMWAVLSEFDHVLDNLKRLSSDSEFMAPIDAPPTVQTITTDVGVVSPLVTDLKEPLTTQNGPISKHTDFKRIISQFEDAPLSPKSGRDRTKHDIRELNEAAGSIKSSSPPPAIGRVKSPFLTRKEHDTVQTAAPDMEGKSLGTGEWSTHTTPSQGMSGSHDPALPIIRVNSASCEIPEMAGVPNGHMANVNDHMTCDKDQLTSTTGHTDWANGVTKGTENTPIAPQPPMGPEVGARKLCEGWSPTSSESQTSPLSPTPTTPTPTIPTPPLWTPKAVDTTVISTAMSNVRTEEEDEEGIPVWMETPIDDHLVPMRSRVESEVIRRPTFQNDTVVPPSLQTHPLESPSMLRKNVRPSSLRRWKKKEKASSTLETSSEFTQCLSSSDVYHLNLEKRGVSPDGSKGKISKLSIWPKKNKVQSSPPKEPTSPNAKKTHFMLPFSVSPKPKKQHGQVNFRLSHGGG